MEVDGVQTSSEGGADPDAFFKIIIDGHYAYDELRFYSGYGLSRYDLSAVEYSGKALLECNPREQPNSGGIGNRSDPGCYDASKRLLPGSDYLTPAERRELVLDTSRAKLAGALSPFCRSLPARFSSVRYDLSEAFDHSGDEASVDINNDGKLDRVFFFENVPGADLYEGYGYLVAFTGKSSSADAFMAKFHGQDFPDSRLVTQAAADGGGQVIKLAMENEIFRFDGAQYIYAFSPFPEVVPSATVSKMLPNNSISQVCAFP